MHTRHCVLYRKDLLDVLNHLVFQDHAMRNRVNADASDRLVW